MSGPGRWPLRTSLQLGVVGLTATALLVAGAVSALALRAYLLDRTDDQLHGAAALVRDRGEQLLAAGDPAGALRSAIAPTEYLVELRTADGAVTRVTSSAPVPARPLLEQLTDTGGAEGVGAEPVTVSADPVGRYRVVVIASGTATVLVGLSLEPVTDTVRQLVIIEAAAAGAVLLVLAVLARVLVARRLRPLDAVTATATAISGGDLGHRVPVTDGEAATRTEVGRLSLAVNGMLERIQAALAAREQSEDRLRRFVADASHELRTPLTSLRGYLHLLRTGAVTEQSRPDIVRRLDDETARMATLVDDLLFLARLDAEPQLRHEPVDLVAVVRDAVADATAVEPGRDITLTAAEQCLVTGDESALRQVMSNLLANVRQHTPPGTPARVTLTSTGGWADVAVTDSGPGVRGADPSRLFERFYRGDAGRDATGGTGLGLAIVAEVARAHGGEVEARTGDGGHGLAVRVRLPATG